MKLIYTAGFTMIELIISLSISSFVLLIFLSFLYTSLIFQRNISEKTKCLQDSKAAINIMGDEIRSCREISPSSSADKLILCFDSDIISYELKDGKIKRTKNSSSQYLTADLSVARLYFIYHSPKLLCVNILPNLSRNIITAEAFVRN